MFVCVSVSLFVSSSGCFRNADTNAEFGCQPAKRATDTDTNADTDSVGDVENWRNSETDSDSDGRTACHYPTFDSCCGSAVELHRNDRFHADKK